MTTGGNNMTKIVHIKDGNEPTLKELQGLVGRAIDGTWQVLCWELVRKLKQKI